MTYTVLSGTLNSSIPYHTMPARCVIGSICRHVFGCRRMYLWRQALRSAWQREKGLQQLASITPFLLALH